MTAVAAPLLAGASLMTLAPDLPGAIPAALTVALGIGAAIVRRIRLLGWLLVGAGAFALAAGQALDDRLSDDLAGHDLLLTGRVVGVPESGSSRVRFLFEPDREGRPQGVPSRLRLNWYDGEGRPGAGRRWRLRLRLRPPGGASNPGSFDYERWLLERRIGATGYVRASPDNSELGPDPWRGWLARLRAGAADGVARVLGQSRAAGIVVAVTLGLRQGLDEETRRVLRVTGTAHLMAISGLHVGMVAGLGMVLGRLVWSAWWRLRPELPRGAGRRGCAVACGWLCAVAYTFLAGAGIPTRRALIMLTVAALMVAWRRRLGPWAPLAIAASVLFAVDPLAVLGAGFWLSILAVAGLTGAAWGRVGPFPKWRGLVAAQWGVSLALLVPGLLVFGGVPTYGPLVNMVAVPLFGLLVVPLALGGLLGLAVGDPVAAALWLPAAGLIDGLLAGLGWVAAWPGAWVQTAGRPGWLLGLAGAAAATLLLPLRASTRAACAILIVPLVCWRPEPLPDGAYRVSVLDVGQGLAAVVRTRRHTLVFDTGPAWRGGGDAGAAMVAPFLAAAGVRKIDALVLSHGDGDHRGGAESLARAYPPARRWFGPDVPPGGAGARRCAAGAGWRWDGVEFRFLHPPLLGGLTGNDSSCVLLVNGPGGRTLLTGDIEAPAETALVGTGASLAADLVVAPHHGSRTSSTAGFVAAAGARWVIFPAGRHNRWGFPAADVVARWRAGGALAWTTGHDGAVQLLFEAAGPVGAPLGWRCEQRRFWRPAECAVTGQVRGRVAGRVPGPNDSQYHLPDPAPTRKGPDG